MKLRTINEQDMLKRVNRFILDHPIVPPNVRVTALATDVSNAIIGVDSASTEQTDGDGEASGGVATKREKSRQLRDFLKDVARVARSLDRETHPGLAERFRLPRTAAYAALTASARAMIAEATPLSTELIAHGLSATFLADLNALLTAFEAGSDAKISGMLTKVGGTAGLTYRAALGVKAAQKLDAIFRAHFRDDPVTLEVWRHARHIEASSADPDEPETPPDSGTLASVTSGASTTAVEGGTVA